jgi:hypothetical protein
MFTETPISETIRRYSATTVRRREAESSPNTAYWENHTPYGTAPERHAAHCQRKWCVSANIAQEDNAPIG